jgi:hypothetical protein
VRLTATISRTGPDGVPDVEARDVALDLRVVDERWLIGRAKIEEKGPESLSEKRLPTPLSSGDRPGGVARGQALRLDQQAQRVPFRRTGRTTVRSDAIHGREDFALAQDVRHLGVLAAFALELDVCQSIEESPPGWCTR